MSHYDAEFTTDKYNYQSWSQYKKRINQKKTYIRIQMMDVKMKVDSRSQGEGVIVSFEQAYQSSNYETHGHKELYLLRRNKAAPWLILEEGAAVHSHHSQAQVGIEPLKSEVAGMPGWVVILFHFKASTMRKKC
jgi:hypothetical protein